jgi:type I restriction enzyme S subunit
MKRWPTKPLGDVCAINPKLAASEPPAAYAEVTFVPMAAVDEVSGTIVRPERRRYSEVAKGYTPFREKDVLFAKITPCMQNGKAAIARNLCAGLGFGSTEFHVLRPCSDLLPQWVFAFIRQPSFRSAAEASFTGSAGQKRVPADFLKKFPIPVPPLEEQERIVKLLDEADELRKLRAQSDSRTAALLPALFYEMFGDPLANSRGWPTNELRQLGRVVTGSTPSSAKEGMFGGEIPFITPGDLERNTRLTLRHVTEAGAAEVRTVRASSTLVCCIGATIGKTDRTWKRSAFNQQINAVEWGQQVDDDFGVVCMKQFSGVVIRQGSSTALPILKKSLFEQIRIPVPPISLQKEFAARVAEVRALEAEQAASRSRLAALFKALLYNAFQGDL